MAPKEGAGSRRHRSVSVGRTPHGVDGIRRDETRRQATRRGGFRATRQRMSLGNLRFHRLKVGGFLPTGSLDGAQQQSSSANRPRASRLSQAISDSSRSRSSRRRILIENPVGEPAMGMAWEPFSKFLNQAWITKSCFRRLANVVLAIRSNESDPPALRHDIEINFLQGSPQPVPAGGTINCSRERSLL